MFDIRKGQNGSGCRMAIAALALCRIMSQGSQQATHGGSKDHFSFEMGGISLNVTIGNRQGKRQFDVERSKVEEMKL